MSKFTESGRLRTSTKLRAKESIESAKEEVVVPTREIVKHYKVSQITRK